MESALPASASPSEGRPPAPRFLSHGMVAARPFALAAAVVCAGLAFGAPARAADTAKDPVVATVAGKANRRPEVDAPIRMSGAALSKLSPGAPAHVAPAPTKNGRES